MKQGVLLLLLMICLVAGSLSGCMSDGQRPLSEPFQVVDIDVYNGIINSSGVDSAVQTRIYRNADGTVYGDYDFVEGTSKVVGMLYGFQLLDPLRMRCRWKDKYGSGELEIMLNVDKNKFAGKWNVDNESVRLAWTGSK